MRRLTPLTGRLRQPATPLRRQARCLSVVFFFFFQAEDGIRDLTVTGVQTCALPISVVSRSATDVPCPGSRGSSTARPAAAKASARPRMELGLPVKPWTTSTPCGPPGAEYGSAPGNTVVSDIGVVGPAGQGPPFVRGGPPVRVGEDAVHRAGRKALVAPAT